jgi:hypothetical protein
MDRIVGLIITVAIIAISHVVAPILGISKDTVILYIVLAIVASMVARDTGKGE